jgi:hypothetical protein
MSYSLYIPNIEAWKRYFKNPSKERKTFYTVSHASQHGEKLDPIKLVSPTEQIVEQAKSSLKRMREDEDARLFLQNPVRSKRKRNLFPVKKSGGGKKRSSKKKK